MKRILFALLLLASGSMASGQIVSPTINYQGRAQDGDGNPVTGDRQVTLTIYNAATGGNALFTETHPTISFNSAGTFTAVIGGATPGGIPPTIGFDQPRWIGVTISGFNDGNEIPRLRFHGSPYSFVSGAAFRANQADSARAANRADVAENASFADSAVAADRAVKAIEATSAESAATATVAESLLLPAVLESTEKEPTLTVRNTESSPAMLVEGGLIAQGAPFAVISRGSDSTTGHYVTAETAGNTRTPDPGGLYRDNVPLAWGQIEQDGRLLTDFGIAQVAHNGNNPGIYLIQFDNSVALTAQNTPQFSVVITPHMEAGSVSAQPVFAYWDYATDPTGPPRTDALVVYLRSLEFGQDNRFSIVVFGRPAN